jgi:16S rRNA (cytosine967-C5)-methyltransferase
MPAPARIAAFDILLRVERGAFASDLLLERTAKLDSRDAGLAAEIVFGVLRYRARLDHLIELYGGGGRKLDPEVRAALRMGIYQVRWLERIPEHAAVADAVDLVKRARKRSAAGFVNAILRKADRRPVPWPTREIALSCPEWLLGRWESHYGREAAEGIARAALDRPEAYIRVFGPPPEACEPTEIPGCYRLTAAPSGAGPQWGPSGQAGPPGPAGGPEICARPARQPQTPRSAAPYRLQDIGSQSIVPKLRLQPGHRFLDLCAAPGNKTAQALESGVRAVACDVRPRRLAALKGLNADLVVADGTRPLPFSRPFDRILVDAPCSGTGTLGRNPEIKWRLRPEDLADFARRQSALLANARQALAPGGLLVYSTCSLEPEENEAVLATLPPELVVETSRRLTGRDAGDGFFVAVIQSEIRK